MIVKVLGPGCARCNQLEKKVRELVALQSIDAEIHKISDLATIMGYGIMSTPGLVINERVVSSGVIPKDEQIVQWLKESLK